MSRRAPTLIVLATLAAVSIAACGGSSGPSISDPKEIITKAVATLQAAHTVHIDATVDGTVNPSFVGGQSAVISVDGSTLSGDIDLAGRNLHLAVAVPALLGMTADVIVINTTTYTRVSLTGDKYVRSVAASSTPADNPADLITDLTAFLARPDVTATKKGDAQCGSKTCYTVEVALTADQVRADVPAVDLGDATVVVSLLVEKDAMRPAGMAISAKGSKVGDLNLKVTYSAWDKAVTINAPAAEQVQ